MGAKKPVFRDFAQRKCPVFLTTYARFGKLQNLYAPVAVRAIFAASVAVQVLGLHGTGIVGCADGHRHHHRMAAAPEASMCRMKGSKLSVS